MQPEYPLIPPLLDSELFTLCRQRVAISFLWIEKSPRKPEVIELSEKLIGTSALPAH